MLTELGKPPTWPRLPMLLENYWTTKLCKNSFQKFQHASIPPNSNYITSMFPLTTESRFLLELGVGGWLVEVLGLKMREEKEDYGDKLRSSPTSRAWMSMMRMKLSSALSVCRLSLGSVISASQGLPEPQGPTLKELKPNIWMAPQTG